MIEAYAFLAAFTVQILVVSVLHPAWLTRFARAKAEAQLPGWERNSRERFLTLYRALNAGIAVLGLALLGWLFNHMQSPDWHVRPVSLLLRGYIVVQILPFFVINLIGAWVKRKALTRSPPEVKRTASMQRRGLFDFVSPLTVSLAVLGYFLFAAFVIYIQQHPLPGFSFYPVLRTVTLVYALNTFLAYWLLYRRKRWPLETNAYRMHAIGVQVKIAVYASIALIVFISLNVTLSLLHLPRWAPFAMSVYVVTLMLICSMLFFAPRRQAEADRLGPSPAS
jgi:MFS family permease